MEIVKSNQFQKISKLFLIVIFNSLILTISAKIKIPFWPVPMTMQTFVVLLIGVTFGFRIGLASVSLYLFEGILGLPVFSNSPEKGVGIIYFTGPTMGYLIGFLAAVFLIGFLKLDNWLYKGKHNFTLFFTNYLKILISVGVIYLFGLIWLSYLIGFEKAIIFGLKPFWIAEIFKISILAFLVPFIIKYRKLLR